MMSPAGVGQNTAMTLALGARTLAYYRPPAVSPEHRKFIASAQLQCRRIDAAHLIAAQVVVAPVTFFPQF